jgi:predicted nuclease of predicted toxin-antitoxin system
LRLLFDQNLSPALVRELADDYPGSAHVRDFGMAQTGDTQILAFAASGGYVVVTKDGDFADAAAASSEDTRVIWIRLGNCTTREVARAFHEARDRVDDLLSGSGGRVLELP